MSESIEKSKTKPADAPARKKHRPFKARFTQLPELWGMELEKAQERGNLAFGTPHPARGAQTPVYPWAGDPVQRDDRAGQNQQAPGRQ